MFGKFVALNERLGRIPKGAITSIIGPNGAGRAPISICCRGALAPTQRQRRVRGPRRHRVAAASVRPYGRRQVVPDHQRVSATDDAREYPLSGCRRWCRATTCGVRARGFTNWSSRPTHCWRWSDLWESRERAGQDARPWRAARAGNRHGAGEPAAAVAAGRADRRHEPGRNPHHDGPDRQARAANARSSWSSTR